MKKISVVTDSFSNAGGGAGALWYNAKCNINIAILQIEMFDKI
jgi:hypothetical protein